jgi:zinc/manganese transport system substrate-binding protein
MDDFWSQLFDFTDYGALIVLLQRVQNLIGDGLVRVVVYNTQTGGPQTDAIIDVATDARVPLVAVTETLPEGMHYLEWQTDFLVALRDALLI